MIAKDGLVIAGGSWNALSATDPEPSLDDTGPGHGRRVLDRSAAYALEETGFVDVAAYLRDLRPTVGHAGGLRYRCDRIYSTFPDGCGSRQYRNFRFESVHARRFRTFGFISAFWS
jgi:hypothetical protein